MIRQQSELLDRIRQIHADIRDAVVEACEHQALEQVSTVVAQEGGDTIFALDRISEEVLLDHFTALAEEWSCVVIAEGLGATGRTVLPKGRVADEAELVIIVDPIDGTRGLIYQKRSAWILTGVAPNHGAATGLMDIELAVQTEIPLVKQHLCDSLWASRGGGVVGERLNRIDRSRSQLRAAPSAAVSIAQGYGGLARFFPGARDVLAAVEEAVIERVLGPQLPGQALAFEDQYISTGGQLYELLMGHDRWIADLRPLVEPLLRKRGRPLGLCCHPYDLCTELIAREAGVVVTDPAGGQLQAPLDVSTDVAWIGYANQVLAGQVGPVLRSVLHEYGLRAQEDVA